MLVELGKRRSADHLTLCEKMLFLTLGCVLKKGAAEKCKGEGLRGRQGPDQRGL